MTLMRTLDPIGEPMVRAEGPHLYGASERKYLDWWNNSGACPLGAWPLPLIEALQAARKLPQFIAQIHPLAQREQLAAEWCQQAGMDAAFFTNSGTETTETAIKLLRLVAHQRGRTGAIWALADSFHGRTYGALASSDSPAYHRDGMGPHLSGFRFFNTPKDIDWEHAIGIIATPIQCYKESSIHSDGWWQEMLKGLRDHGQVGFHLDDVQTGCGRCGEIVMSDYLRDSFGIRPDIIGLGKGVALGLPLTITMARGDYAQAFIPGQHFCTFGGASVLPMLAATGYLEWLRSNIEAVRVVSGFLETQLRDLGWVRELQGMGMVWSLKGEGVASQALAKACYEYGLIVTAFGPSLKLFPQLNTTPDQLMEGIVKLDSAYRSLL